MIITELADIALRSVGVCRTGPHQHHHRKVKPTAARILRTSHLKVTILSAIPATNLVTFLQNVRIVPARRRARTATATSPSPTPGTAIHQQPTIRWNPHPDLSDSDDYDGGVVTVQGYRSLFEQVDTLHSTESAN